MPKAKLKFNLPEENQEFDHAVRGVDYYCQLMEVNNYIRRRLKSEITDSAEDELRSILELIYIDENQ